jgi:penicillin-binding protein 2
MYPPGSIFKPLLALVAMQEGLLDEERGITCNGAYFSGSLRRGCHNHPFCTKCFAGNPVFVQYLFFFTVYKDVIDEAGITFLKLVCAN